MTVQIALDLMGIDHKQSGDVWGISRCPLHDDLSPSLSINYERGTWKCYSGCGHGSIVDLALRMIGDGHVINLAEVKQAMSHIKDPMAYERKASDVDKVLSKLVGEKRNRVLPDAALWPYLDYSKHIAARGISQEVAIKHGIKFDMTADRIVIPIRDHGGKLRGIEARNVSTKPKYSPIIACDKGTWLWGAWAVQYGKPLVVFEGALGAARAATLGIANVSALLGSSYRQSQLHRMVQAAHVTIALDPDKAGMSGAERLYDALHPHVACSIAHLPKDIDDIGAAELEEAIMH